MPEPHDLIVPIVFPDYQVLVEVRETRVDVLPWTRIDDFRIPAYRERLEDLGHAGILLVRGVDGFTKYFEYGRYSARGHVRNLRIPNAIVKEGKVVRSSLARVLDAISRGAGKSTRIAGAVIEGPNLFERALQHAMARYGQRTDPTRRPYNILNYNCITFVQDVIEAAGVDTPWMLDPRPSSYIHELRDDLLDVDYSLDAGVRFEAQPE